MTPVPEPLARVAGLMSTFRPRWSLCGGWAVDAWLGRQTRDHADVDIAVFQDDHSALFEDLSGWQLIAHDNQVVVLPRLLSQQRIDAPAAVDPGSNSRVSEALHDPHDINGQHHGGGDWG